MLDTQMGQLTIEKLELKHKELISRSFSDPLPKNANEWKHLVKSRLIDHLPVGVAILDENFILQDCNKTYGDYGGRHSMMGIDKALGKSIFEYMPGIQHSAGEVLKDTVHFGTTKIEIDRKIRLTIKNHEKNTYWDANLIALTQKNNRVDGLVIFCLDTTEQKELESFSANQQKTIDELKTVIRVLNELRIEDKIEIVENVYKNTSNIILPLVNRLRISPLTSRQEVLVTSIENNLKTLTSDFSSQLASFEYNLTQKEILIAGLIKEGKTSKEIAEILNIACTTIDFHRNNIRKKIGINKKSIDLRSFLLSLI